MTKMRAIVLSLSVMFSCMPMLHAGIFFADLDLNDDNKLLFTAKDTSDRTNQVKSLFSVDLENKNVQLLTTFPQSMSVVAEGSALQIMNKYGAAQYDIEQKTLVWTEKNWKNGNDFSAHSEEFTVKTSASPDGVFFCQIERTASFKYNLTLKNSSEKKSKIIARGLDLNVANVPVKWSSDGSMLFYEKEGSIYFLSPQAFLRGIETLETNRKIGDGSINSIAVAGRFVFYISGDCVYKINTKELYTLGLYADVIGTGTPVGRLAEKFSPENDIFAVSQDLKTLALVRSNKSVSAYALPNIGSNFLPVTCYAPYINETAAAVRTKIFFGKEGSVFLWALLVPYSGQKSFSTINKVSANTISETLSYAGDALPAFSTDGGLAAVVTENSVLVCETGTWITLSEISGEKFLCTAWLSASQLFIGGQYTIKHIDILTDKTETILLSSVDQCSWGKVGVTAQANGKTYVRNGDFGIWAEIFSEQAGTPSVQNGKYRVYATVPQSPKHDNDIFYRTLTGIPDTRPIFAVPEAKNTVAENRAQNTKKAAFVFDAYDTADFLPQVLYILQKHNVKASFFFNGEFMKRYPLETRQIASSGNECASMFFSISDLLNTAYTVDENFVRRGLARNEDLFFHVTGKELSLLWHTPNYKTSSDIITSGEKSGYKYVQPFLQSNIDEIDIENIVKISGSGSKNLIIPISLGQLGENSVRSHKSYGKLELLVTALLSEGFEIVPVSELEK